MSTCIFCNVIGREAPGRFLYEDDAIVAFDDLNPKAPVHVLIVPKKHIPTLSDLTEEDADLVGRMVLVANRIAAERKIGRSGYRLVFNCNADAGQSVFHIHLHLLGGRPMLWPPG